MYLHCIPPSSLHRFIDFIATNIIQYLICLDEHDILSQRSEIHQRRSTKISGKDLKIFGCLCGLIVQQGTRYVVAFSLSLYELTEEKAGLAESSIRAGFEEQKLHYTAPDPNIKDTFKNSSTINLTPTKYKEMPAGFSSLESSAASFITTRKRLNPRDTASRIRVEDSARVSKAKIAKGETSSFEDITSVLEQPEPQPEAEPIYNEIKDESKIPDIVVSESEDETKAEDEFELLDGKIPSEHNGTRRKWYKSYRR